MQPTRSSTVCVDHERRGGWEVGLGGSRERLHCATLEDARRVALQLADRRQPCQLVVRDAYHRVIAREVIAGDPGRKR